MKKNTFYKDLQKSQKFANIALIKEKDAMLKKGIYEKIINQDIKSQIEETQRPNMVCLKQNIDWAESPQMLANYLANVIRQKLEDIERKLVIVKLYELRQNNQIFNFDKIVLPNVRNAHDFYIELQKLPNMAIQQSIRRY